MVCYLDGGLHTPEDAKKPPSTGTVMPVTKPARSSSKSQDAVVGHEDLAAEHLARDQRAESHQKYPPFSVI